MELLKRLRRKKNNSDDKRKRKSSEIEKNINQQMMKLYEIDLSKEEKETKAEEPPVEYKRVERKKINYKNKKECMDYVTDQCEMIVMATKQLTETKLEYAAVTEYLTDIQKIDQIPADNKEPLVESARRIVNLTQERNRFQNREVKIAEVMYKHLEKYEDVIPDEIVKMKENEAYEELVKSDLRNLESEKTSLTVEKDEITNKKSYIQSISIIVTALVLILFAIFAVFHMKFHIDVTLPMLLTIILGIGAVFVLFLENNRSNIAMNLCERKLNKVIGLTNKVKIKFVNNRNNLDYTYQKFRVHNSKELIYLWDEYVKLKDEKRRYQKNTELLESYREALLEELAQYHIEDTEVWLYQPLALIDGREMVEVRHRLNERRQKLREQIDYNNGIIRDGKREIEKVVQQLPELEYEIDKIMQGFEL